MSVCFSCGHVLQAMPGKETLSQQMLMKLANYNERVYSESVNSCGTISNQDRKISTPYPLIVSKYIGRYHPYTLSHNGISGLEMVLVRNGLFDTFNVKSKAICCLSWSLIAGNEKCASNLTKKVKCSVFYNFAVWCLVYTSCHTLSFTALPYAIWLFLQPWV